MMDPGLDSVSSGSEDDDIEVIPVRKRAIGVTDVQPWASDGGSGSSREELLGYEFRSIDTQRNSSVKSSYV